MNKSTIIATCLVNSSKLSRLDDAENAVRQVFLDKFPNSNFSQWNCEIGDKAVQQIIEYVGRTSRINVRRFIEDLWQTGQS
jgi:hypothetical protein